MAGRERNPERSRERILDAALEEFAAHGYAGARVSAIAMRAGLNKQLISHHFGGKRALYRSVMGERRLRGGGEMEGAVERTPDTLSWFFEHARNDPEWIRVLLWEALEDRPGPHVGSTTDADSAGSDAERTELGAGDADMVPLDADESRRTRYVERIAWVRREQEAGRLPAELDPAMLLLTLLGSALYPVLLPDVCELTTGSRPDDPDFAERYRDHLVRFAAHLADQGSTT